MALIKHFYKISVILLSDLIWIYYGIVLFTSIKVDHYNSFSPMWMAVAGMVGIAVQHALVKKFSAFMIAGNVLCLVLLVFLNGRDMIPTKGWSFGIIISVAICVMFIRSASFAYRELSRKEMLQHFEGNIIFYVIFASIFGIRHWGHEALHLVFLTAIVSSLLGMSLTLESEGENEEIKKVGHSSSFTGLFIVGLISIPLLAILLLIPAVSRTINIAFLSMGDGLKWIGLVVVHFIGWLLHFVPSQTSKGFTPVPPPKLPHPLQHEKMLAAFSLPIMWIELGIVVVLIVGAIWILPKFLKFKPSITSFEVKQFKSFRESWWLIFKKKLIALFMRIKVKLYCRFPNFYSHPVYWYYYQLQKWGKRNGFPISSSETIQEYVKKIIFTIPVNNVEFVVSGVTYNIPDLLYQLATDYQASYYGNVVRLSRNDLDYRILLDQLKSTKIWK